MLARILLSLWVFLSLMNAGEISPAKYAKLVQKGEKVAVKLCDSQKLALLSSHTLSTLLEEIEKLQPCTVLSPQNKEALAYFILASEHQKPLLKEQLHVPKKAKCPVCGMFVSKYPKWASLLEVNAQKHYFDGVKDMMKFYLFDIDFPYDRTTITQITVTDFYTLHALDAKEAFYVSGSDIYGPMGNELIPFGTLQSAQNFLKDHKGDKILHFNEVTPSLVMGLDGIVY